MYSGNVSVIDSNTSVHINNGNNIIINGIPNVTNEEVVINNDSIVSIWTDVEDNILLTLFSLNDGHWKKISDLMKKYGFNKSIYSCYERYHLLKNEIKNKYNYKSVDSISDDSNSDVIILYSDTNNKNLKKNNSNNYSTNTNIDNYKKKLPNNNNSNVFSNVSNISNVNNISKLSNININDNDNNEEGVKRIDGSIISYDEIKNVNNNNNNNNGIVKNECDESFTDEDNNYNDKMEIENDNSMNSGSSKFPYISDYSKQIKDSSLLNDFIFKVYYKDDIFEWIPFDRLNGTKILKKYITEMRNSSDDNIFDNYSLIDGDKWNIEKLLCSVCLETSISDNSIMFCNNCHIAVHTKCYGKVNSTKNWKCDVCCNNLDSKNLSCTFCLHNNGAMRSTQRKNIWIHVVCALFIPEIYPDTIGNKQVFCTSELNLARLKLKCSICDEKGICVQCTYGRCLRAVHPSCVINHKHGYYEKISIQRDNSNRTLSIYCPLHWDKDKLKLSEIKSKPNPTRKKLSNSLNNLSTSNESSIKKRLRDDDDLNEIIPVNKKNNQENIKQEYNSNNENNNNNNNNHSKSSKNNKFENNINTDTDNESDEIAVDYIVTHSTTNPRRKQVYKFLVRFVDGDESWLPYHEVNRLEALDRYLEENGDIFNAENNNKANDIYSKSNSFNNKNDDNENENGNGNQSNNRRRNNNNINNDNYYGENDNNNNNNGNVFKELNYLKKEISNLHDIINTLANKLNVVQRQLSVTIKRNNNNNNNNQNVIQDVTQKKKTLTKHKEKIIDKQSSENIYIRSFTGTSTRSYNLTPRGGGRVYPRLDPILYQAIIQPLLTQTEINNDKYNNDNNNDNIENDNDNIINNNINKNFILDCWCKFFIALEKLKQQNTVPENNIDVVNILLSKILDSVTINFLKNQTKDMMAQLQNSGIILCFTEQPIIKFYPKCNAHKYGSILPKSILYFISRQQLYKTLSLLSNAYLHKIAKKITDNDEEEDLMIQKINNYQKKSFVDDKHNNNFNHNVNNNINDNIETKIIDNHDNKLVNEIKVNNDEIENKNINNNENNVITTEHTEFIGTMEDIETIKDEKNEQNIENIENIESNDSNNNISDSSDTFDNSSSLESTDNTDDDDDDDNDDDDMKLIL